MLGLPREGEAQQDGTMVSPAFPLATIDFEASSLEMNSYPIEVGVAVAKEAGGAIDVWSALIRPEPEWCAADAWDLASERIHRISRRQLSTGMAPVDVLNELNRRLSSINYVWCGDGKYDPFWFGRLRQAAPQVCPSFALHDVKGLVACDRRTHNRFADAIAASEAPHRAGPDAERLCRAIMRTFANSSISATLKAVD